MMPPPIRWLYSSGYTVKRFLLRFICAFVPFKKHRRLILNRFNIWFNIRLPARLKYPNIHRILTRRYFLSPRPAMIDIKNVVYFKALRSNFESFIKGNERNADDLHRFYSFIFNLEQLKNDDIPGDFAELGVYRGNTAAILAYYAKESGRRMFLLDTFQGFHPEDLQNPALKGGFSDTNIASVKNLVGHDDICTYIEGRFPDSITEDLAGRRFCFVSLDCDLYKPMKAGLDFFYPRLEKGGYLFIHDYYSPYWSCKKAIDEFCDREGKRVVLLPGSSGTAVLRK
jgi:hypothetical protein